MEREEIRDIIIAALALSAAFAIALQDGIQRIATLPAYQILGTFVLALVVVFTSFILHELGHRQLARRFGAYAEFKRWNLGLVLALLTSLFGYIFAAPGAVIIHARADLWGRRNEMTRKRIGMISLIGPAINLTLALAFLALNMAFTSFNTFSGFLIDITVIGFFVNAWLALFNLLPVPPLDGSKVFMWDKRIWVASIAVAAVMIFAGI